MVCSSSSRDRPVCSTPLARAPTWMTRFFSYRATIGFGADLLAAAGVDADDPGAFEAGVLEDVGDHVLAVVVLRDDGVGGVLLVAGVDLGAPAVGGVFAGGVVQDVEPVVEPDADDDDPGLVRAPVGGSGGVDGDDDAFEVAGRVVGPDEHVPGPQGAFDVFEEFAVDLLAAEPGALVRGEDVLLEGLGEVAAVGVGGDAMEDGVGLVEDGLERFGGFGGGGDDHFRVEAPLLVADAVSVEHVVPDALQVGVVGGFVGPDVAGFGSAEPVGLFGGVSLADAAVGPRQLLLRWLPFGHVAGFRGGEQPGSAFDHGVAEVGAGGGDQDDAGGELGGLVGDFGAAAGLAGASAAGHGEGEPVIRPLGGVLVGAGVLPEPLVERFPGDTALGAPPLSTGKFPFVAVGGGAVAVGDGEAVGVAVAAFDGAVEGTPGSLLALFQQFESCLLGVGLPLFVPGETRQVCRCRVRHVRHQSPPWRRVARVPTTRRRPQPPAHRTLHRTLGMCPV